MARVFVSARDQRRIRLFLLIAALPLAAAVPRVVVAAAAPDLALEPAPRTTCPDRATLQAALAAQLGAKTDPQSGWRVVYGAADDGAGTHRLWLELRDRDDQRFLRRELPASGVACADLAAAAALVIDRFFAELGWTAGGPLPAPMPLPPARSTQPSPSPSPAARLSIEAGGGLSTRRGLGGTALVGARLERGWLAAALHLMVPTAGERLRRPEGGEAALSEWGGALSLLLRGEGGRLEGHAGPLLTVFRASASSFDIPVPKNESGTTLAAGLTAGASVGLGTRFRLGLDAALSRALVGDKFVVAGWGTVLEAAPNQFTALARLAVSFLP